MKKLFKDLKVF